jgi:hypothetical protein
VGHLRYKGDRKFFMLQFVNRDKGTEDSRWRLRDWVGHLRFAVPIVSAGPTPFRGG